MSAAATYHILWTTYGTWLPGDARGWIEKNAAGLQDPDPVRDEQARQIMSESAVLLTDSQRTLIEETIREHCRIRGWLLHGPTVATGAGRRHWFTEGGRRKLIEDEVYFDTAVRYVLEGQ